MAKNIIVGDIGSTKSAWRSNFGPRRELSLPGYNPLVHDDALCEALFEGLAGSYPQEDPTHIWYYGAGVIDDHVAGSIRKVASSFFAGADIMVASDLMGACVAACGNHAGVVAILGTGSHCAVYDGNRIVRQATSLGYVLGDEGSGSDIGKHLLHAFFHRQVPYHIALAIEEMLPGGRIELLKNLYQGQTPNQYLASFARVSIAKAEDDWVRHLVTDRFKTFIRLHVLPLSPEGPIHVIGSIGHIFAGLLAGALEEAGLEAGEFIRDPVPRLFETHLNQIHHD